MPLDDGSLLCAPTVRGPLRGFTLLELLIVLAIAGILVAMSLPMLGSLIASSRISGATDLLFGSMQRARAEAILNHWVVVICRSVDPNADPPDCDGSPTAGYGSADWAAGWIVFAKGGANTHSTRFEPGDRVVARQLALGTGPGHGRAVVWSNASPQQFSFDPWGLMSGTARTFRVDHADDARAEHYDGTPLAERMRCIPVNFVGRPRLVRRGQSGCT
jgi:type IV fimbrial biogenesis protein FimT